MKAALRIPSADSIDDSILELAVESASRMIDSECDRNFYSVSATRDYVPNDQLTVNTDDLTAITSVKLDDQGDGTYLITLAVSDYQREPVNERVSGNAYPTYRLRMIGDYLLPIWGQQATVRVEGTYGFTPVPTQVIQATVIQAIRIFKRLDSPLGLTWGVDGMGMRVGKVDPDVAQLIRPFKKFAAA
jgi:hypothetical protein